MATAATGVATALVGTPLIIDHVGKSGYGVWAISMAAVIYLGIVEAGFAPVVQRRVAASRGAGDEEGVVRVFWSTVFFYVGLGLVAAALVYLLAPVVVPVFGFPPGLEEQSVALFRLVALAIPLGLVMAALTNALQGAERFQAVAITAACGAVAYLGALVALTTGGASLSELGWAVIAQLGTLIILRGVLVLEVALSRPRLVSRGEAREMASMSARLQVSVASLIVNGQSDRVVAGLVSPAATVAQVSVAAQVAESGRLVAAAPLVPAANRFAALAGAGATGELGRLFSRSDRLWSSAVTGGVAIGALCAVPLVEAWLGSGFLEAGAFAAVLVVAYGASIVLGVRMAQLRALGRPGLESRTGIVLMGLNLAFTVPLAVAFQAPGVVAGTLLAYLAGSGWCLARFRQAAPEFQPAPLATVLRPLGWAVLFGALASAWSFGVVAVVPPGWALVPVVAGMAAAAGGFLRFGLKSGPRALFSSLSGE
ncbi:MAG: oligosaccharide flippase family protein [Solirubrobacterales bacterium]